MLLTEEEAKKRWCPHARVNAGPGFNRNSGGEPSRSALCIASECMAWRFYGAGWRTSETVGNYSVEHVELGYCGLSGSPEKP